MFAPQGADDEFLEGLINENLAFRAWLDKFGPLALFCQILKHGIFTGLGPPGDLLGPFSPRDSTHVRHHRIFDTIHDSIAQAPWLKLRLKKVKGGCVNSEPNDTQVAAIEARIQEVLKEWYEHGFSSPESNAVLRRRRHHLLNQISDGKEIAESDDDDDDLLAFSDDDDDENDGEDEAEDGDGRKRRKCTIPKDANRTDERLTRRVPCIERSGLTCVVCGLGHESEAELTAHRKEKHRDDFAVQRPLVVCAQCKKSKPSHCQWVTNGLGEPRSVYNARLCALMCERRHSRGLPPVNRLS